MSVESEHYGRPPPPPDGVELQLYSMEYCSFAERSRIALAFKGVKHDIVNCNLSNKPKFLLEANPNGQVPVLIHKGEALFESDVIVEYLDDAFPDLPQLYPKDLMERAKARCLSANQCNLIRIFYSSFTRVKEDQDLKPEDKESLKKGLKQWIEEKFGDSDFFLGNSISFVDVLIYQWLHRFDAFSRILNVDVLTEAEFPRTVKYLQCMHQEQCIQDTKAEEENQVKLYQAYFRKEDPSPYNVGSKHPIYASKPKV